jgi:uncharacterized protein (TIGR01244 family)
MTRSDSPLIRQSLLGLLGLVGLTVSCSSNASESGSTGLDATQPQGVEETFVYSLPASLPVRNFPPITERVAGGGPPTAATIAEMKALGYSTIINMRTLSEPGVAEEAALAEAAGLHYVHIPVSGTTANLRNALALSQALEAAPEGRIFLHCGSGSRVGAMWGLKEAIEHGLDQDEAAEVARRSGMRSNSLESSVRSSVSAARSHN